MAATASLGRNPHLIWTVWIGTGLGRPVLLLGARWAGGVEAVLFDIEMHDSFPFDIGSVAAYADILLTDVASDQYQCPVEFGPKVRKEGRCRVVIRSIPIAEVADKGEHPLVLIFMAHGAPHMNALRALAKIGRSQGVGD